MSLLLSILNHKVMYKRISTKECINILAFYNINIAKPIVALAIFTYEGSWEKSQYTMEFPFLKVLTFNYLTLHLRKINWRDFIRSNNPAAAALLSNMGFREEEKIEVKKEFLRMLTRM